MEAILEQEIDVNKADRPEAVIAVEEKVERIFVVLDPSDAEHTAFNRAIQTAALRKRLPVIKVFVCADPDHQNKSSASVNANWLNDKLTAELKEVGVEFEIDFSWGDQWVSTILEAAKAFNADRIYLPLHDKPTGSVLFAEAKWRLIRTAFCPVVLIKPTSKFQRKRILAAVNFQALESKQQQMNKNILRSGAAIAALYGAEFHVVNAYTDTMNYPDRGFLVKESGVSSEFVHFEQGYTPEAVSKVAKELDADLVLIGTLGQNGRSRSSSLFRGNTSELVIAALDQDVMIINS